MSQYPIYKRNTISGELIEVDRDGRLVHGSLPNFDARLADFAAQTLALAGVDDDTRRYGPKGTPRRDEHEKLYNRLAELTAASHARHTNNELPIMPQPELLLNVMASQPQSRARISTVNLAAVAKKAEAVSLNGLRKARPHIKRASIKSGKLALGMGRLAGRSSALMARAAWALHLQIPLKVELVGLAGAAFLLVPSDSQRIYVSNASVSATTENVQENTITPLPVPYTEAQMQKALAGVNQYNFAPGQKDKTNALKATRFEIAKLEAQSQPQVSAQVVGQLAALKAIEQTQLAGIKPNTKLDVMNGAKWALLNTPRSEFNRGLKGVDETELYGFFTGKGRIESALTNDAEYAGNSINHARGVVQLETQPFLTLLSRHYEAIGENWPKSDQNGFAAIRDDLFAIGGSNATIGKLNAADPALQTRFRDALIDKTQITMPDGSQTSRGVYLSFVIAQYFMDEAPKPPQDLTQQYGANIFRYLYWQMGKGRYQSLIDDVRRLDHYDDKAATAAAQLAEGAREKVRGAQLQIDTNLKRQQANQARWQSLQPKRVKRGRTVRVSAQTAAQKQQQIVLIAQQKQLRIQLAKERQQRATLAKQYAKLQAHANKLRAPLDIYHAHLLQWDPNKKAWRGQAAANPMWWRGKIGSNLRMPREVFSFVRDTLEMGKLSHDAERVAANWIAPIVKERDQANSRNLPPVNFYGRLPRLVERDNKVIYLPAGMHDPVPTRSAKEVQYGPAMLGRTYG